MLGMLPMLVKEHLEMKGGKDLMGGGGGKGEDLRAGKGETIFRS